MQISFVPFVNPPLSLCIVVTIISSKMENVKTLYGVIIHSMDFWSGLFPLGLLVMHWTVYSVVQGRVIKGTADSVISTGVSLGFNMTWLWIFRNVLPWGSITPSLLDEGRTLGPLAQSFLAFCVAIYPYYALVYATGNSMHVSFLLRKSVPALAIVLTVFMQTRASSSDHVILLPSTMIRLVAWLLRFGWIDTLVDIVSVLHAIAAVPTTKGEETREESSGMLFDMLRIAFKSVTTVFWLFFWFYETSSIYNVCLAIGPIACKTFPYAFGLGAGYHALSVFKY